MVTIKSQQIISLILVASLLTLTCRHAYASEQGWVLTQRSKELGDQYVYISAHGLKCVNPRQGVGLVIRAPSWDISFYNEKTKLYYSLTFSNWQKKLAARGSSFADVSWQKGSAGQIAGLKATKYTVINHRHITGSTTSRRSNAWSSAEYWVADDIKVPAQLADMLAAAYAIPTIKSIPLRVTFKNTDGQFETILDTYQQRSTQIPDSYLTFPASYQLAKSEVDVMMTEQNKQLLNDIVTDLGKSGSSNAKVGTAGSANTSSSPLTLPNGQTVSKDQIGKFIDALKHYKPNN